MTYFPGFRRFRIEGAGAAVNVVTGGAGPPVLLLHGWPQTHLEWRTVALELARDYTVVATDLRGYGDSSKPADGERHSGYCKRAMAQDQIEVMRQLGWERFSVVGHDRGGRVAHRMALDHPQAIEKIAVLDIVPTHALYSHVTKAFATAYFHWFFLIQPAPLPETLLQPQAEFFLRAVFGRALPDAIPADVFAEYVRYFSDAASLHAMCEDYRAAASVDMEHDAADLERRIEAPLLALWGERGAMHALYDVAATWRERAHDVTARSLPTGHWLPEESPAAVYATLRDFLS